MTANPPKALFHSHLETLIASAFSDDTRCHGWRLNLSQPTLEELGTTWSGKAYEHRVPITFLDKVAGEILFWLDGAPSSRLSARLADVACQIASLVACSDRQAALELDALVAQQAQAHPSFHWYGVYRLVAGDLLLTSFRGAASPHVKIPTHEGICGAAVRENNTLNIPNVNADPRYLACSIETKSELVVPIRDAQGNAIAEIDIDSHQYDAFTPELVGMVEGFAGRLAALVLKLI